MDQIRNLVKRRIVEAGLTQRQFAERAHVSPGTLSDWLKRGTELRLDKTGESNFVKICGAYRDLRPHAAVAAVLAEAEALALAG